MAVGGTLERVITVSMPTRDDLESLGGVPDGVEVLVWNGHGERPDGAERIRLFVGQYNTAPPAKDVLGALPDLEVIQLTSAGVEPWLPVVPEGVQLCNGRGIHGGSSAELAFAGLLAILRDLPAYHRGQVKHAWDRWQTESLDGKRVMVIGAGDVGDRIAAASRVFGAETTMVARTARDGIRALEEIPALLPDHDIVALALPLTDDSRGMVDERFLAAMPDGAVLLNIARGAIVDTDALVAELTSGRLRAFLDVTDPEPLPADHPLWDAPNLVLTPHVGGGTKGWERRASRLIRRQVERLRDGEALENLVTQGY